MLDRALDESDETLVNRAASGDRAAFAQILTRHYDAMYRIAYRILGDEADDLVQEICIGLAGKLSSFEAKAKFSTWLHRVVVNRCRDRLRQMESENRAKASFGAYQNCIGDHSGSENDDMVWLEESLNALPPDLRETVALILGEEMTHRDAATVLGISEGTVSWRMSEVKKTLRNRAKAEDLIE
ncbi:MAG: RNA polymerase sigma factor [Pseudomonadota bacterium]